MTAAGWKRGCRGGDGWCDWEVTRARGLQARVLQSQFSKKQTARISEKGGGAQIEGSDQQRQRQDTMTRVEQEQSNG